MNQNSNGNSDCSCNDYSLQTANTGIAAISSANTSLTGASATTVLTAAASGTLVKSVIIKAIVPVTTGMVRLFISNGTTTALYKEIPIPNTPVLAATPTPLPMLQMFEVCLAGGLKLESGYTLLATTQNAQAFNVIAEGLDWKYPSTLPDSCCSYKQEIGVTGLGVISAANANLDGTGTIVSIFTAPGLNSSNGSRIKSITIKAMQSTNEGIVRLFIYNGSAYSLMKEIYIPQTTQSGFEPSFKVVLDQDFCLKPGYSIGASTQLSQSFALTVEAVSWIYAIS